MIKDTMLSVVKFWIVAPVVYILGDLREQTPIMWLFIGWGWLTILVMFTSLISQLSQL